MTRPSDEMLMAYADGELSAEQSASVEAHLAGDSGARAFVAALRDSRKLAEQAFSAPMHEPPPRDLVEKILATPLPGGTNVIAMPHRAGTSPVARHTLALAASLALIAGSSLGYLIGRQSVLSTSGPAAIALGPAALSGTMGQLLESRPAGSSVDLGSGAGKLTVVATFSDRRSRPCREIEMSAPGTADRPVAVAIACRSAGGSWSVEGAAQLRAWEPETNTYVPSGATEKDALDGLLALLGAGRALTPVEEKDLLASGWKRR